MAREPNVSWDRQKKRYAINWWLGSLSVFMPGGAKTASGAVISQDGRWYRDRLPKSASPEQVRAIQAERRLEYYGLLSAAREASADPDGRAMAMERIMSRARAEIAVTAAERPLREAEREEEFAASQRRQDQRKLADMAARLGVEITIPSAPSTGRVVKPTEVLDMWIAVRSKDRNAPEAQAIQVKQSQLCKLFAFVAGVELPPRLSRDAVSEWMERGNLAAITEGDIRRYRAKLVREGGRREYDAMTHWKAIFGIAREYFDLKNPMLEMKLPAHFSGERPPMTEPETRVLLLAARKAIAAGDTLLWAVVFSAFMGTGNKEILQTHTREIGRIPSGRFAGHWYWDARKRRMKDSDHGEGTGYRARLVPIRSTVIKWGFGDYVASRAGKPLFDVNLDVATQRLNKFIRETLEAAGLDATKTFYCFRGRVHGKVGDDVWAKAVTGHATDIHQKYIGIDPVNLPDEYEHVIAAVEGVPDPTL